MAGDDLGLGPGEAAECDARLRHGFGPAEDETVECLSVFGPQGERMDGRAKPKRA